MAYQIYLAYVLATIVIILVPGPTVTLIIANSMTHGTKAGLLNVAGTQLGIGVMIGTIAIGLASIVTAMGWWFDWLRLAGAAYLIWLGWKLLRAHATLGEPGRTPSPRGGFFLQGFLVAVSNPKTLLFFGAFIPQFIDPTRDYTTQVALMGVTSMVIAAISDATYAVLSGKAGGFLSRRKMRVVTKASGLCLIGGGVWLAFARAK